MKKFFLMAVVVVLGAGSVCIYGETSVWKISSGDNVLYLGGTIHILRESDYPLPHAFDAAFEQSDLLVFETSADDPLALLNTEPVKAFLEECTQVAAMIQENDEIGRFIALSERFTLMTTQYENVYQSISDPTIVLTDAEEEICGEIIAMVLTIQETILREDIQAYLARALNIVFMIEEKDELQFITMLMNPDYTSLEVILSPETFGTLKSLCEKYRFPLENVKYLRPYIAYTGLLTHVLSRFAKADGVDVFFQKKAKERGKAIEYFETNEFQYNLLATLGSEYGDSYYAYLFREFESGGEEELEREFDRMVDAWKKGEAIKDAAEDLLYEKDHFPAVYNAMLADRNNAWLPIIERYLTTRPVEFIMVGAGHLFGPDGLLPQLETRGYHIEQR